MRVAAIRWGLVGVLATTLVMLSCGIGIVAAPKEAAYDHLIRLKVVHVAKVESVERRLLKLTVQRWYGKIDGKSLKRNQEHETQEFKILFPAAPNADVKIGDIIDYRIVRYIAKSE